MASRVRFSDLPLTQLGVPTGFDLGAASLRWLQIARPVLRHVKGKAIGRLLSCIFGSHESLVGDGPCLVSCLIGMLDVPTTP